MKKAFFGLFIILAGSSFSQNWIPAGLPVSASQVRASCVDTINNKLYVAGAIALDGSGNFSLNSIWIYDGAGWTKIDTVNNLIRTLAIYNNKLIVGGDFQTISGQSIAYLAQWDGATWQSLGNNIDSWVGKLKAINGDLYVMGNFSQIGGITAYGIAKWNGSTWSDVFGFPPPLYPYGNSISDVIYYNGDCYVGGSIESSLDTIMNLMVYRSSIWQKVGVGDYLRGTYCNVSAMQVFNGELYVSGNILKSEGNVGNGLERWNGSYWRSVGTGVQDVNNSYNSNVIVEDMKIHNNLLYFSGAFGFAGNIPALGLASWDGNKYCGYGIRPTSNVDASPGLAFFQDTLYLLTSDTINGLRVNKLAKYKGGSKVDTCSLLMGIKENISTETVSINIYPTPSSGEFSVNISNVHYEKYMLSFVNTLGQEVYCVKITSQNQTINVSDKPKGIYFVNLVDSVGKRIVKKVVLD